MNRIAAIALLFAATSIGAGSASAQDHQVKATIPFEFKVGRSTLPAGTYTLGSQSSSPGIINVYSRQNKVYVAALGMQNERGKSNTLVFHHYGSQYFLSDIRTTDSSMNIHFATTKAEKRAKAETEQARLQVNDPVLLALNQ
jgi:hypothetical protein